MLVVERKCKTALGRSQILDYCLNPYVGCQHACAYCYADYLTRRISKRNEEWGEWVEVKVNLANVLRKEIGSKRKGEVFLSSLTDPYQPLEEKHELTRKCLEILLEHQFPICVETKSALVQRDVDLFKKFEKCVVGLTLTTLDERVRKNFEPNSSSVEKKLQALQALKENGIQTFAFFGPVLPFLSDENLNFYFKTLKQHGVKQVWVDKLNLKPGVWSKVENVLQANYPELAEKWKQIFFGQDDYYQKLKHQIRKLCSTYGINCIFCY